MNQKTLHVRDLAWGATQRLQFIEFRLLWEGHVNRSDLIETFGISVPQSTLDFREYLERAPGNMDYDKRLRHYFPTPIFKPVFISDHAEGYLSQLTALDVSGENQSIPGLIGATPPFYILPAAERHVDTSSLQQVLLAIRNKFSMEINYQSLSTSNPSWRRITPHSLASDGLRWHIRAYCHTKNEFRDFVLGRIIAIRDQLTSEAPIDADTEWNEIIQVTIVPNPALSADQQKIIERDYAMKQGKSVISVRRAMLFYLKHRLGVEDSAGKSPAAQQVVISEITSVNK